MTQILILIGAAVSAIALAVFCARRFQNSPGKASGWATLIVVILGVALLVTGNVGSTAGRALLIGGSLYLLTLWTVLAPRLTSIIWWAFVASMLLSAALLVTLPIEFKSLALWMALSVSLVWVAFQFWCYWEKRDWLVATGMIVISLISGIVVATIPPPV